MAFVQDGEAPHAAAMRRALLLAALGGGDCHSTDTHKPFMVLKTGRSGSTWFADLLSSMVNNDFERELIHSSDASVMTPESMGKLMVKLLERGSGFTVNPKNTPCVNYSRVVRAVAVKQPRVVLLERCNAVKHAVSYMRLHYTKHACGGVKANDCPPEVGQKPMTITPSELQNALVCTYRRTQLSLSAFLSVDAPKLLVSYEALQADTDAELQRVAEFIGERNVTRRTEAGHSKIGTDSLRKEIENFDALRPHLEENGSACLLAQLDDADGGVCNRCPLPAAWWDLQCDDEKLGAFSDLSLGACSAGGGSYYDELLLAGGRKRWGLPLESQPGVYAPGCIQCLQPRRVDI